jgi:glycosyltransferase involved in cell wall biosynthesis
MSSPLLQPDLEAPGEPLHIVFISDAWHPQINGVVRTLEHMSEELTARGHKVTIVGPPQFRSVPLPSYKEIRLALVTSRTVGRYLRRLAPDAIHIATEGPLGWAARRYCLRHRYPFTTSYHTRFPEYVAERMPVPLGLSYAVMRRFHRAAAVTMVATNTISTGLAARGFKNLGHWTRGVDTRLFHPREKSFLDLPPFNLPRPIMLNVGRIAVEKNLEAFLSLDLPGTKLLVGDGPSRAKLQAQFPDAVFAGAHTGEALARYYAAADVFVFPSKTDTFGLVLLEALASGLPVAAFPVAGPLDILAEQDSQRPVGVLSQDLAEAVTRALKLSPEDCRAFALNQSWAKATDQFLTNMKRLR